MGFETGRCNQEQVDGVRNNQIDLETGRWSQKTGRWSQKQVDGVKNRQMQLEKGRWSQKQVD